MTADEIRDDDRAYELEGNWEPMAVFMLKEIAAQMAEHNALSRERNNLLEGIWHAIDGLQMRGAVVSTDGLAGLKQATEPEVSSHDDANDPMRKQF